MLTTAIAIRCRGVRVPPSNLFNGMPTNRVVIMIAGIESTTWVMFTRSRMWFTAICPQRLPATHVSSVSTIARINRECNYRLKLSVIND